MTKASRPARRRAAAPQGAIRALYAAMYRVVRRIPRGKVVTYGQLAALAGAPGAARAAGAAMKTSPPELDLPWQRVVGSGGRGLGKVNIHDPIGGAMQRAMLEAEGVRFSARGAIDLADHGWAPLAPRGRAAASRAPRRRAR